MIENVLAEVEAEEVADGDFDAGFGVAVPVDADDDFFEVIGTGGGDGEPDVGDDAGAGGVEDFE